MLDIITAITTEGYTAEDPALAPSQQTPSKPILASLKGPNKRKWGTSGGVAAAVTPEPKRTRYVFFLAGCTHYNSSH